jgi:hypothetical protein
MSPSLRSKEWLKCATVECVRSTGRSITRGRGSRGSGGAKRAHRDARGVFDDVLVTEDWTPLEPDVRERKFYARDVGLMIERQVAGGDAVSELAEFTAP